MPTGTHPHDAFVVVSAKAGTPATSSHGQAAYAEAGGSVEHAVLCDFFAAVLAHHGDEDLGVTHVTAHFNGSDIVDQRASPLTSRRIQLSQLALHLIADTLGTAVFFCHVLLPVAATR